MKKLFDKCYQYIYMLIDRVNLNRSTGFDLLFALKAVQPLPWKKGRLFFQSHTRLITIYV